MKSIGIIVNILITISIIASTTYCCLNAKEFIRVVVLGEEDE